MGNWQTIILTIVGNGVVVAAFGWLAKSFVERLITRDIERFKIQLEHELQRITMEHQIRFSKLHEKRAEVIAKLYRLLDTAHVTVGDIILASRSQQVNNQEQYRIASSNVAKFKKYVSKNQIYFSKSLSERLWGLVNILVDRSETVEEEKKIGEGEWKKFYYEAMEMRVAIETEFRGILGVKN